MDPAAKHALLLILADELADSLPPRELAEHVGELRDLPDAEFAAVLRGDAPPPAGRMADAAADPPPEVVPGPAGDLFAAILRAALRRGVATLSDAAKAAVVRYLAGDALPGGGLFLTPEREVLARALLATIGAGELAGRAAVRSLAPGPESAAPTPPALDGPGLVADLAPLEPEAAVAYLRGLAPAVGVDPGRFGPALRRKAFTLAVATEAELAGRVRDAVAGALADGTPRGDLRVKDVLDAAGVSAKNPDYSSMVFRTASMSALHDSAWDEVATSPDMAGEFPVWQYHNPCDARSRQSHAARDGRYYPATLPFAVVRGTGPEDVCNDRCSFSWVHRLQWEELARRGAVLSTSR